VNKTFFLFVAMHAFDRQTHVQSTDGFLVSIPCVALHAVAR